MHRLAAGGDFSSEPVERGVSGRKQRVVPVLRVRAGGGCEDLGPFLAGEAQFFQEEFLVVAELLRNKQRRDELAQCLLPGNLPGHDQR